MSDAYLLDKLLEGKHKSEGSMPCAMFNEYLAFSR